LYRFFPSWICFGVKRTNVPFSVVAAMRFFERFGMARTGYVLGTEEKCAGFDFAGFGGRASATCETHADEHQANVAVIAVRHIACAA
jgi:hypothetical protein